MPTPPPLAMIVGVSVAVRLTLPPLALTVEPFLIDASTRSLIVLPDPAPAAPTPTPAPPPPAPTDRAPPMVKAWIVVVSVALSKTPAEAVAVEPSMMASTLFSTSLLAAEMPTVTPTPFPPPAPTAIPTPPPLAVIMEESKAVTLIAPPLAVTPLAPALLLMVASTSFFTVLLEPAPAAATPTPFPPPAPTATAPPIVRAWIEAISVALRDTAPRRSPSTRR